MEKYVNVFPPWVYQKQIWSKKKKTIQANENFSFYISDK